MMLETNPTSFRRVDMIADAGYTPMRNATNELPKLFQVLDSRIFSLPGAVRGEMAVSISRLRASGAWMALSESRMPASERSRRPGFPGWPRGRTRGPDGKTRQPLGKPEKRSGKQDSRSGKQKTRREERDGRPDGENERRDGKNGAGELRTGHGSPTLAQDDPYRAGSRLLEARD